MSMTLPRGSGLEPPLRPPRRLLREAEDLNSEAATCAPAKSAMLMILGRGSATEEPVLLRGLPVRLRWVLPLGDLLAAAGRLASRSRRLRSLRSLLWVPLWSEERRLDPRECDGSDGAAHAAVAAAPAPAAAAWGGSSPHEASAVSSKLSEYSSEPLAESTAPGLGAVGEGS